MATLDYAAVPTRRWSFLIGFVAALFLFIAANLIVFALSRGAYNGDGFEVAGWPIHFYSIGGVAGVRFFSWTNLFLDAIIGITVALISGFATRRLFLARDGNR